VLEEKAVKNVMNLDREEL